MSIFEDDQPRDTRATVILQPSEQSLLAAASRIFAARITSGQCTTANEKDEIRYAVGKAIQMASLIDLVVRSENEL